jgi:hypothetical protein
MKTGNLRLAGMKLAFLCCILSSSVIASVSLAQEVVPGQNLNSDVLMMQPSKDRNRGDAADLLRSPKIRSIFIQREMRPDLCVANC